MSQTRDQLLANVTRAQGELGLANQELSAFDTALEQNTFATLEDAAGVLEDRLRNQAFQDCEGSHNCGSDEYEQEFIVDNVHYVGKLKVQYNRHDKMYYYIDESEFSYARK